MKIQKEWFSSTELVAWLSGGEYSLEDISGFFTEVFSLFEVDESGRPLADVLFGDWTLFRTREDATYVIDSTAELLNLPIRSNSLVMYSEDVMEPVSFWNEIKDALLNERRFTISELVRDEDCQWDLFFSANEKVPQETILYRGRTNKEENKPYTTEADLSAPPKDKAVAGRVNPFGISYLYLSDSPSTVLQELRSVVGDQVSVGEFKINKDLNVVDFTQKDDLFEAYSGVSFRLLTYVQRQILLKEVAKVMSKPIRRYDIPELDYLATQFVCEYIRVVCQEDGIVFQSSRQGEGKNYVVFDKTNVNLVECLQKTVSKVDIEAIDS